MLFVVGDNYPLTRCSQNHKTAAKTPIKNSIPKTSHHFWVELFDRAVATDSWWAAIVSQQYVTAFILVCVWCCVLSSARCASMRRRVPCVVLTLSDSHSNVTSSSRRLNDCQMVSEYSICSPRRCDKVMLSVDWRLLRQAQSASNRMMLKITILFFHIEAGASFVGEMPMSIDLCMGIFCFKRGHQCQKGFLLCWCTRILRMSLKVKTSDIADADAVGVVPFAMCAR